MLRPFLIVGVGGSGGKTLRGLRHALELRLEQAGWDRGIPAAWQLLHFDTPIRQDGAEYVMPFLPATDYKGLVAANSSYENVHAAIVGRGLGGEVQNEITRMLPDPQRVRVPLAKGAGQFRAVGRAVVVSKLDEVARAAKDAIDRMRDSSAVGELELLGELLGARKEGGAHPEPTVIIVSSVAGGSGAGQYLDVIEAVKSTVRSEPWAHQFYSLLYAPDVFDQIKGGAGIASNALATIAETMSGFWTKNPSKATLELYRSKGISVEAGSARARVGAEYPFIIGRQNSKVAFDNQGDVYSAISTSMTAWMTDDKVQGDLDAYVATNWNVNVAANALADHSRLRSAADQAPAFASLGFGRITLGREKFLDYASERFARSVLDRALYAHTEEDPRLEQRTEREWIEYRADQALGAFIRDLRLDEEMEGHDDVINQLRPDDARTLLKSEFRQAVRDSCVHGLDAKTGGLSESDWYYRLTNARTTLVPDFLARDTSEVDLLVTAWTKTAPAHIIDTVERYIARQGLPVVVELLERLSRALDAASSNLLNEAQGYRGWITRVASRISEALGSAANKDSIRPEQDAFETALNDVEDSFEWEAEANLREVGSRLVVELRSEFIVPLKEHLASAHRALLMRVTERVQDDGRENEYPNWPHRTSTSVPRKYEPAPNERLLVKHTEYPAEFQRLVEQTFGRRKFDEAVLDAVTDLICGPRPNEGVANQNLWSFIEVRRDWKPATTGNLQQLSSIVERPMFAVAEKTEIYQQRAHHWMLRSGFPFESYITETLDKHFDAQTVAPHELKARKDAYREGLAAALGASEPLVKLNPSLLSEVHAKSIGEGNAPLFSAIPFSDGSDMYELTKAALVSAGVWNDNTSKRWFKDAKVDSIEIFTPAAFPFQPMVMDSVMAPIARGWLTDSATVDTRAAFWQWKRGRLLKEAAPADPDVFDSMLRGWYVAKALGQLTQGEGDDRGPRLGIWSAEHRTEVSFPFPLLYAGNGRIEWYDYPGVVMESLTIAVALCNAESSLAPLYAYHALLDLGGKPGEVSPALESWLRDGKMPVNAPMPNAERAGTPTDSLEARQSALRAFFVDELDSFTKNVIMQDVDTSVFSYPVSWEIRDVVVSVLEELRSATASVKPPMSGI
ncbi:tubulin-like doman-containing protein [Salinibacterium sp. ZJ70]|uniref:tubulin-like doman-containing protein n=1 Tax=Salinibacterium sp. ZJ70 TaxID=2708084 RepID=UPI0014242128|nr:tubulin-like doman-containing protein [Salinibacterium sp. ZJ70]